MEAKKKERIKEIWEHYDTAILNAKKTGDWTEIPENIIANISSRINLTTSFYIANREVEHEIEIISAECVYGMNFFRDLFAGIRDIVGGRSNATQKVLRDARRTCLAELKREALMVGSDAVISVDLDYQELSGGQKNGMLRTTIESAY